MHPHLIPQEAQEVLQALSKMEPAPESVWLFGSRANGRATPKSDTDLLVFASQAFVDAVLNAMPAEPQDVDVLVVIDGERIVYPWTQRAGSLRAWEWTVTGATSASYVGTKCLPDEDLDEHDLEQLRKISAAEESDVIETDLCQIRILQEQAIRVFPIDA